MSVLFWGGMLEKTEKREYVVTLGKDTQLWGGGGDSEWGEGNNA